MNAINQGSDTMKIIKSEAYADISDKTERFKRLPV